MTTGAGGAEPDPRMPAAPPPAPAELVWRPPSGPLRGVAARLSGYREAGAPAAMTEPASLAVPLIIGFGSAFGIALGGGAGERWTSLMAGLHPGPVAVRSDGAAACVQLDLTPLGAVRLLGGAAAEMAGRMAPIEDALGRDARDLPGRLAEARGWPERLDLLERFVAERLRHEPSPTVAAAFGRLAAAGGDLSVTTLADELGVSRTGLSRRFTAEIGVGPKAAARVMRFTRARHLARGGRGAGWADLAVRCGYADQAHLVREFRRLGGETPGAWLRRSDADGPGGVRDVARSAAAL